MGKPPSQAGSPVELIALLQVNRGYAGFPAPHVRVSARRGLGRIGQV